MSSKVKDNGAEHVYIHSYEGYDGWLSKQKVRYI
jgi:hypothetical protein